MTKKDQLQAYQQVWNNQKDLLHLLGIQITRMEPGYAIGEMEITEDIMNINGAVHGGAMFSLADSVGGAAATAYGSRVATVSSDLQFLSPGMGCKKLICEAKELKHGKKMTFLDVYVKDDKDKLLCKGTFTYFNLQIPIPELQPEDDGEPD